MPQVRCLKAHQSPLNEALKPQDKTRQKRHLKEWLEFAENSQEERNEAQAQSSQRKSKY